VTGGSLFLHNCSLERRGKVTDEWAEYDRWGTVLHQLVYSGGSANQPVYLNVENELLLQSATLLGLPSDIGTIEKDLVTAVTRVLELQGRTADRKMFRKIQHRLDSWRRYPWNDENRDPTPPPVLPVLAVFSRAAEIMGENEEYTSQAYYRPLMGLLGVRDDDQTRLETAFRSVSEKWWDALNNWLRDMDGQMGLPTAEPLGPRYVGIPLSQALMRDADRQLLLDFFENQRLQPGTPLSANDMMVQLRDWFARGRGSASMKAMWKTKDGKTILTDAAIQALLSWDGTQLDSGGVSRRALPPLITARLRRVGLGRAQFRFGFVIRGTFNGPNSLSTRWQVDSSPESPKPLLDMEQLTDRLLSPASLEEVDADVLVSGVLRLSPHDANSGSGVPIERRPQPVVVAVHLEEAGRYLEVENVRLGESHLVLVNSAARKPNGEPMFDIESLLSEIAQPGFAEVQGVDGLPVGWTAYRDVVVMREHDREQMALDPLRPAQTSTLVVADGLRLPGRDRWSDRVPLTLRAVGGETSGVRIRLSRLDEVGSSDEIHTWETGESQWNGSTVNLPLRDGRYRLELRNQGSSDRAQAIATRHFELCSGQHPRQHPGFELIEYRPGLSYDEALPGELSATPRSVGDVSAESHSGVSVIGAQTTGSRHGNSPGTRLPGAIWWRTEHTSIAQPKLTEPAPPDSCAITGSHHEIIDQHVPGQLDRGECQGCGRIRMYRAKAPRRRTAIIPSVTTQSSLDHLRSSAEPTRISGADLLDALAWLGGGPISEFNTVMRQVDDSALTADEALRVMESLGHIDVRRDPTDARAISWRMAPPCLAGQGGNQWTLVGRWAADALATAQLRTDELGGTIAFSETGWLPSRVITDLDESAANDVARASGASAAANAGQEILSTLRPLVDIVREFPRVSAENIYDVEWFNPETASWRLVTNMNQPGAFRIRHGFVTQYVLRESGDIANRTMARTTPHVAKCFAARQRPLISYQEESHRLHVPLGAELPGLYGRAIILMSGRPPGKALDQPLVVYENVPAPAAAHLLSLMEEQS